MSRKEYFKEYYQRKRLDPEWVENQRILCNQYKATNREKAYARSSAYKKTYVGKRSHKISEWKSKNNLRESRERMEYIFDRWYFSSECELCGKEYSGSRGKDSKCMDHHHASKHFRCVCCSECNVRVGIVENKMRSVLLELHRYYYLR